MTDDDALDPVVADRFRPLDEVAVPDTWSASDAVLQPSRAGTRSMWMIGAAAAAVVALVAGFVLVRSGDDPGDLATVDATSVAPPGSTTPVASATVTVLPSQALATAFPLVVAPGGSVTITPAGLVEHYCEKVNFFGPVTGTIMGGEWMRNDPVTATYSCDGPVTDASVVVTIPELPDGDYRFCVAVGDVPEGCAVATISGDAPSAPLDNALATADPVAVEPGGMVTITPAATIERYCTDIVAVLPVGDGPVIGQVLGGSTWQPVPQGAPGPTWPACLGTVTDDPLAFTVPDVPDGVHRFCIAAGELPEGCAAVTVTTAALLAVASPSEVATGDTITITPAGVVQPICTGVVLVYDVTRTEPVRMVYDPSTGASQLPPAEEWAVPDCAPEPSDLPIEMVVPDLLLGTYAFCIASDLADAGCARVTVTAQRFVEPTTPPEPTVPAVITEVPAATIAPVGPIVVTSSDFFGVRFDVTLATADAVLRDATLPLAVADGSPASVLGACLNGGAQAWLTQIGGMWVLWEGDDESTARATNWGYTGGAVAGGQSIATETGLTVGSTRQQVVDVYGDAIADYGDEMDAGGFRWKFRDGVVVFIGRIDCGD